MMKRTIIATAAVAVLTASTSVAAADCNFATEDAESRWQENPESRDQISGRTMRDIRDLRDAAMTLSRYGKGEACQEIADAVNEMMANPQELTYQGTTGDVAPAWTEEPQRRTFQESQPIDRSNSRLRADEIIGADIRGENNQVIGEVSDLVLDDRGQMAYAVIAYGGIIGLGEDESAVPFNKLRMSEGGEVFFIAMTEEELEEAPRFPRGSSDWLSDSDWRDDNNSYYEGLDSPSQG